MTHLRLKDVKDDPFYLWSKGPYNKWLLSLRTYFYDFTDGWTGPEGDPLYSKGQLSADFARVADSKTSMESALLHGSAAVVPGAMLSAKPAQLQLL